MKNDSPKKPGKNAPRKRKAKKAGHLLGLGLDNDDGHVRITRGENFSLAGGSKDTHEQMTETAVKFNEQLKQRGKRIEQLSPNEFFDLMNKAAGR